MREVSIARLKVLYKVERMEPNCGCNIDLITHGKTNFCEKMVIIKLSKRHYLGWKVGFLPWFSELSSLLAEISHDGARRERAQKDIFSSWYLSMLKWHWNFGCVGMWDKKLSRSFAMYFTVWQDGLKWHFALKCTSCVWKGLKLLPVHTTSPIAIVVISKLWEIKLTAEITIL